MTVTFEPLAPFPEDAAQRVLEYAKKLGLEAVSKIIDTIRDLFGHPENIGARIDAWGDKAKRAIDDSIDSITNSRADLKAYWEGSAYDSYSIYVDHLEKVFNTAAQVFGKMKDHLQDIAATMTDLYNKAIRFLVDCATIIVRATGGIIANIKEAFFGVAEPVANAIASFIDSVGNVVTEVNAVISEYRRSGQDLKFEITELKVPETIPMSSVDADGWEVRKRK
ncbi:WXG100 family type VII secretion target [Saccharopolyspora spinosa]|uniref:Type VII secretion system (Wss) protein ESAT-6 n=1 Tax=Saccharopolyspora spinosa TaxID=60894 RepID=A0A2N3Y7T4_SACSN|nr:hypothetical protein [Saccharopolyspora spinosa]PKW18931.1 hypothetical protein A8926_7070 [Saccharopolyspora spinosa]